MLTEEERSLVRRVFTLGPAVLVEEGYSLTGAEGFLARPEVVQELAWLTGELANQESIQARVNFTAKRQLARLSPGAIAILAQGMTGPIYDRDEKGIVTLDVAGKPKIRHPEVTDKQLRSANLVLDSLGLTGGNKTLPSTTIDLQLNLALRPVTDVQETVTIDPSDTTHEQQALSRERIRIAMEKLGKKLPQFQKALSDRLSGKKAKPERKPRALPVPVSVSVK